MADKIYKNPVDLVEQEYKNISDEAIDLFGKGQKLDPAKQQRYDQVKQQMAAKAKQQERNAPRILEDQDIPVDSNEERLKEGGLVGRFTRAGYKVSDVTDNSFVVNGYKIVANNNLGFDVYKGDQKVANDIGNQRNFIALLEMLGGK